MVIRLVFKMYISGWDKNQMAFTLFLFWFYCMDDDYIALYKPAGECYLYSGWNVLSHWLTGRPWSVVGQYRDNSIWGAELPGFRLEFMFWITTIWGDTEFVKHRYAVKKKRISAIRLPMKRNEFEMSTEIIKCVLDEILLLDLSRGHGWVWLCEGSMKWMSCVCLSMGTESLLQLLWGFTSFWVKNKPI